MNLSSRRTFVRNFTAAGLGLGLPEVAKTVAAVAQSAGPSNTVRLAVIGLGGTGTVGGVGGRGHQLIARLREIPGARIAALCDVDRVFLEREVKPFKDRGDAVTVYTDLRRVFDDATVDAVVIATPNHWHALATVWACQAGKDVYVEKPFSYNLWEGRQMVAAARKYGRMVQVGTQNRSSTFLRECFDDLRRGELGQMRFAHALVYRARQGIGQVNEPTPVPASVDYDLWCGPAPKTPLLRKQLHYEWHWFWSTGNGEIGNNGVHVMDLCRWALGQNQLPPRALGIGGRFGFNDAGETPNTHIAFLDYEPAPLICEVRNVSIAGVANPMGTFRQQNRGLVIDCEGGYFAGDALFDRQGKKIRDLVDDGSAKRLEVLHLTNFLEAVRTRKGSDLAAAAAEGHLSAGCCHVANISYRLGKRGETGVIRNMIRSKPELSDAFERCREYLLKNGLKLEDNPAVVGPWLTLDSRQERFVEAFAEPANQLAQRDYRLPFVVPSLV